MGKIRAIIVLVGAIVGTTVFGGTGMILGLFFRSRRVMAWVARNWSRSMLIPAGAKLTFEGRERLDPTQSYFLVGNHQSALDIPIMMTAFAGDVRFMAKDSLFTIPILGQVMYQYGYIPIDRKSARTTIRALQAALARMKDDPISFAVFPEGTRTTDGRLLPFRMGAMKIAMLSGMPIVPFTIDGAWRVNNRARWAIEPGTIRVVFHEPIPVEKLATMDSAQLHDQIAGTIARELGQAVEPERTGEAMLTETKSI